VAEKWSGLEFCTEACWRLQLQFVQPDNSNPEAYSETNKVSRPRTMGEFWLTLCEIRTSKFKLHAPNFWENVIKPLFQVHIITGGQLIRNYTSLIFLKPALTYFSENSVLALEYHLREKYVAADRILYSHFITGNNNSLHKTLLCTAEVHNKETIFPTKSWRSSGTWSEIYYCPGRSMLSPWLQDASGLNK
jgi:hypothetical protein